MPMATWYETIRDLCGKLKSEEDVLTVLDIVVDNGVLNAAAVTSIGKGLGLEWSPAPTPEETAAAAALSYPDAYRLDPDGAWNR